MLLIKTYLKKSPIHGVGVFASEFIKKGTIIWRFDDFLDQKISLTYYHLLPEIQKIFINHYGYLSIFSQKYIICLDDARYMNHSNSPNTEGKYDSSNPEGYDVATRDIFPDQEITCDYTTFDLVYGARSLKKI